ncbi:MAG: hypothetical protein QOG50_1167 [Actinomycetota bacterium]|nr:hypothetical protein [Actinomycetota bacterium]
MATEAPQSPAGESNAGRRFAIAAVVVMGTIIAINVLANGLDRAVGGSEPSGVAGSSYGSQPTGLAAVASLFTHYAHPVLRQRGSLADTTLDPALTMFVIEPASLTADDEATLLEFVTRGGRLVIGGSDPFYLRGLRDHPPEWDPNGNASYVEIAPELSARRVDAAGDGAWTSSGSGTVLAHAGDVALLTAEHVGDGEILFLADASPLENDYLARADDAAFALGLAGDSTRPVAFAEGTHGYGAARGLGAIPTPWKVSLLILAAAAIVLAWSRSRRLGPPDRPARDLPPPRTEYVRALAVSLERARDPGAALAPLQQWARLQIAQRAHLRSDASPEEIDRAAIVLGFSEAERASIWYPPTDDNTALALGQLVSRLSQAERSQA